MINVLQFVRVLDCGGIEKFIFSNYENMDREEIHYDFMLLRNQVEAYDSEVESLGCKKICVDTNDIPMQPRKFSTYFQIYKIFRAGKYDVIHFQSVSPALSSSIIIFLSVLAGIKKRILHSHLACDWRKYEAKRMLKYRLARKFNSIFCNEFLACSELAAEYSFSKSVIKNKKYTIVNNAIDAFNFKFDKFSRIKIREEYGLEGNFVIGNVGRFVKQKNHKFMIDVFRKALEIRSDCCLFLVGGTVDSEPEQLYKIKQYAEEQGVLEKIVFAGERKDITACLSAMDSFVFPSFFEGLGIVGVEAQASGLTVVAAKNYIPHELKISSNFIWMDLNDSTDKWAKAVLNEPISDRENAYKLIEDSDFNILKTAKELESIYRR